MASRGQTITVTYFAWDTSAQAYKTGDVGNHTLRWIKDGTSGAPANSPAEVDSTNAPGAYKLVLTGTECTCDYGTLCGKSSTANIILVPISVSFELLPTALVGGRVDSSVGAMAANTMTAAAAAADLTTELQSGLALATQLPAALTADGNIKADALKVNGGTPEDGTTLAAIILAAVAGGGTVSSALARINDSLTVPRISNLDNLDSLISDNANSSGIAAVTNLMASIIELDEVGHGVTFLESVKLWNALAAGIRAGFGTTQPVLKSLDGTVARVTGANADGVGNVQSVTKVYS